VTIEGIVADDVQVDFLNGARLPPGTRRVDIKYTALRFQTPGRVRFRLRLAGVDRDWVETDGLQRSVTYTNLGNGDFQFTVTASANDGPWNPQVAEVTFSIAPYLYELWSFRILGILAVLVLLVVGYNARTRRIRARNRILEEEIGLRRKIEEQLTESLEEKTVMLKEIHHRVKNNMQVISSLMSLQLGASTEPMIQEALMESQARIRSMALVHETLYQSNNLAAIGFKDYLERLVRQVHHVNKTSRTAIRVEGPDITVPLDQAIPAGLLMNELLTNAIKHAFPDGSGGSITVSTRQVDGDSVELGVADNGKGLPAGFDIAKATTLGLRLVTTLTGQLGGTLTLKENGPGTTITVTFPMK
jgi:two-component sensor histidine kinase